MTEPRMTGTKICSQCNKDLPVISFSVDKKSEDGLNSKCRECRNLTSKKNYFVNKKLPKLVKAAKENRIDYRCRHKFD